MSKNHPDIKLMAANYDIAGLIKALDGKDDHRRVEAVIALSAIGQPAVYALFEAMIDPSEDIRTGAASALYRIGGTVVTRGLIAMINRTNSREALLALERISDRASVRPLTSALDSSSNCNLCLSAITALGHIGPAAADAVPYIVNKLNCTGCSNIDHVGDFEEVNEHAVLALGRIGSDEAETALIHELKHCSDSLVWEIADALVTIGTERAITAVAEVLFSESFEHRSAAVTNLKFSGSYTVPAVPYLITVLNDPESDISEDAAVALGNIGDAVALPALENALHHEDESVVAAAHYAIAKITGTPGNHVKVLCDMLFSHDMILSWEAAELLGDLGECARGAVPSLIELALGDYESSWAAVQALGRTGDSTAIPALRKLMKTRYAGTKKINKDLEKAAKEALENIYRTRTAS